MGELSIKDILQKVDELPALPHVTYRVFSLTSDPKTSIPELAETITADQVLTAKVLRMANSAYYGYARRIFNIQEALIILGFDTIRSLVLAASVYNVLDTELQGYFLPKGELWKHSMSTALIARMISQKLGCGMSDQAFISGLLHDIGKVILNFCMKDKFMEVLNKVQCENIPFMTAEQEILGFDHAVVGARVAEKWNLPEELAEAIETHHSPSEATVNPKLASLIHVADAASMSMGIGLGGDGMLYPFDEFAFRELNLSPEVLEEVMSELADCLADTETLLASGD